ncbi:MAG TPA: FAD-binding protein, partial [Anaerolineae bacterium]
MKRIISYLKCALATTWNILINAATLGRYLWLEGRVHKGIFRNWSGRFRYQPAAFLQPATEEEIIELIRRPGSLRVFGSAHSFNSGVVTEGTLVSLDKYSGVIWLDRERKQLAVKGGTRMRDVIKALYDEGLAFAALPSHDSQSIAGILSTDVHGTGREWGFVSESIVSLKLINGKGELLECQPSDPLFKAAVGGVGAVGVIVEVVVQGVDRFNVAQKVEVSELAFVEKNLDRLLQENDHLSLYLFPFTDKCQLNTWNRTVQKRSYFGSLREFLAISKDALIAAWFGNLAAYTRLLPAISPYVHRIRKGTNLVLESNLAFNRTIYHAHQELEFSVPFESTFAACRRFIRLYEEMYPSGLPYALLEVRFTPPGHDRTLLGPG